MHFFIQELVNGLTQGSLYALIALGYSMVYGVLKLLNFAHGDLYMVGAFIGYFVIQWFGGSTALSIPVPLLLLFLVDLEAVEAAGLALGAVEKRAVGRHVDVGRGRLLLVVGGVDELDFAERPVGRDGIGADRRGRLGDQIGPFPVRMHGEVAWAGARLGRDLARPVGLHRAGGGVELQLQNLIAAEHRHVDVVAGIDIDAMRLGLGVEDLRRLASTRPWSLIG